ncbi:YoaK family protein [Antrihabitans cavernicola]|uniref:DUF1275 domain-containing protein n=1 Tax=Antrihabitans cavernicola TaxID=2495913 RepID=A0A5A7S6G0_9NOCA|nr:YoaK family protein [Spelaeibacter cavernicola]KAA0018520.1 DUF1275 domain-containing protein [Spelaeibacter cavernicola]
MAIESPLSRRWTVGALLTVTFVTGMVDAVSYLALGHVFVANMTGNVVLLGFSVNPASGLSAVASVGAVAGFVGGASLGGRMGKVLDHRPARWLSLAFAAESALIAVTAILGGVGAVAYTGDQRLLLIVVLAAACGLQNSTVRRMGEPDLTTTVLTMTLTGLGADHRWAGGTGSKPHRRLGSIGAMLGGAAFGAWLLTITTAGVLGLAAAVIAVVAAVFGLAPRRSGLVPRTQPIA